MDSIAPPALRPGDRVAVVAPAGPAEAAPLRLGLDRLASRYTVAPTGDLWGRSGYLAAPDGVRAGAMNAALRDPDVRAIFCARGGYGALRILPALDGEALRRDPKPIVGLSDATALLAWALAQGIEAVHGPVVTQLGALEGDDWQALVDLLEHPGAPTRVAGLPDPRGGAPAEGRLVGGNLSLLAALSGTPWAVPLAGTLLLLEDVGERPYRIDRLLTQLGLQAGAAGLTGVRGAAVGELVGCSPPDDRSPRAAEVVTARLGDLAPGRPVITGLPFGHGRRNHPFPLGRRARMDPRAGSLEWSR